MNLDINDPRITAFALGELQGSDATEVARAVRNDPKIRAAVDDVRATSFALMETFAGEAPMLTAVQRQKVRSAGGVVIAEIEQASQQRSAGWKKNWALGMGVAVAVVLTLYMVGEGAKTHTSDTAKLSDFSTGQKSMSSSPQRWVAQISGHVEGRWESVEAAGVQLVPVRSGKGSWALLRSYVNEQHALPPRGAVRIEEMINRFNYTRPSQLKSTDGGVVADMEACVAPWNGRRWLVAVNVEAESVRKLKALKVLKASALSIAFDPNQVSRVRLLGYGVSQTAKTLGEGELDRDRNRNSNHTNNHNGNIGREKNYVIYELEPVKENESERGEAVRSKAVLATLSIADGGRLSVNVPSNSSSLSDSGEVSEDLRFASLVAATGMRMWILRSDDDPSGRPTKEQILSEIESFHLSETSPFSEERRKAFSLIKKALALPLPGDSVIQ